MGQAPPRAGRVPPYDVVKSGREGGAISTNGWKVVGSRMKDRQPVSVAPGKLFTWWITHTLLFPLLLT